MSNKEKPKVTLNYSGGNLFAENNFRLQKVNGVYAPVFTSTKEERLSRSAAYFVVDTNKKQAPVVHDACDIKTHYLSAQNYILAEKGMKGFDFEPKLFACNVTHVRSIYQEPTE